ncbi:MAG TPA: hypothetical protein VH299_06975 [Solirubrobacterales bacterium]|nr:hypothetical protein [Solirubrobacterales bacterium]
MPWVPELFSSPVLARFEAKQQRPVVDVPYFDGLLAGEVDALVASFSGEPRFHHPLRGSIEGEYEFREFVADTERWMREHDATIEDVHRGVLDTRGFEEVVLHLRTAEGWVDLPHAMVADHGPEGRIKEIRIYFSTMPLSGHPTERAPLLESDPELLRTPPIVEYAADLADRGVKLDPCVLVEDGDTCALEYNARRPATEAPAQAGLTVLVRGAGGGLAAARTYDDIGAPAVA